MTEATNANFLAMRILNEAELSQEERDAVEWRSIMSHDEIEKGEGVHDPEVWEQLQNPEPANVFVMDTRTNKVSVVPHLGFIGLLAS